MKTPAFVFEQKVIEANVGHLLAADKPKNEADRMMRACYRGHLLWVCKYGVSTQADTSLAHRQRIIVNMERSRWRLHRPIATSGQRIIVNIPAYHLFAYSDDEQLDMRVNTMWPDETGTWRSWPDVYGYDDIIWKQLQPYLL